MTLRLHENGEPTGTAVGIMIANASAIVGLVFACGIQYQKITNLEIRDAERRASIQELNRVASLAGGTAIEITNLKASMARVEATLLQILDDRRDERVLQGIGKRNK